jgi:hypothetical protein
VHYPEAKLQGRTIRVTGPVEEGGRYPAETITGYDGKPPDKLRRTRLTAATLAKDYELIASPSTSNSTTPASPRT